MIVFELKSENMSHVGGPMGSEHTTTNWTMLFKTEQKAKKEAAKDLKMFYKRDVKELTFKSDGRRLSCDCGPVMYTITKRKVIE